MNIKIYTTFDEIESHYDSLEKKMLDEFFNFAKEHKDYTWINWNMRDINYGFEAIENRYLVLLIDENLKVSLKKK
jgi:hypothetical protein